MKKLLILLLTVAAVSFAGCMQKEIEAKEVNSMKIKLIFDDTTLTATMRDNNTARDFMSLLPITLNLDDYAGTEKVSQLPRKLNLDGAPTGSNPEVGDITLYAPWGNLAIFYRDFGYASGLVILGTIDSNIEYLSKLKKSKEVRIEIMK